MRALSLISLAAPILARQAPAVVTGRYKGSAIIWLSFSAAFIALLTSAIIFAGSNWSYDLAFLGAGLLLLLPGLILLAKNMIDRQKKKQSRKSLAQSDPIMEALPDLIKTNPAFSSLVQNIQAHPVGSTAAAAALGYLLSQELLEEFDV